MRRKILVLLIVMSLMASTASLSFGEGGKEDLPRVFSNMTIYETHTIR